MQSQDDASRCLSSSCEDATPPDIKTKKQNLDHPRLMDIVDPSYSGHRWDHVKHPYYKAPVPANTFSSSGVPVQYPESPHVLPVAGDLYRECHGYCAQTAHGNYGRRNKRHSRSHRSQDIDHWRSGPIGCPCCCGGQPVVHHHPGIHADSVRLFASPVRSATPDGILEYNQRDVINERRCGAHVLCLPDSPEAAGSTKESSSCCCRSNSPSNLNIMSNAARANLILQSEAAQPINREENLTRKSFGSEFVGLGWEDQSNSMTNVDISGEGAKELPANKVTDALLISQPGINSGE